MKKRVLYSMMVLALVLGMALSMAAPVMAGAIEATKEKNPDESPYHVGEMVSFEMTVTNPEGNPVINTLTRIWDTLPDGTVIEFLDTGAGETLVQAPGETATFCADYMVREVDIGWIEPLGDYGVINRFEAEGYDSAEDSVYARVTSNTRVIPPVGGAAFPISRLGILAPWVAMGAPIIAAPVIFARRHPVQS